MSAKHLVYHEATNGYEPPIRNLLEKITSAGRSIYRCGSHRGFLSMRAATHPAGNVAVIAFEPDPATPAFY
jgi:hypothetical protein